MVSEESVGLDGMGQEALKGIHSGAELGEVAKGNMERLEAVVVMEFFSGVWHVVGLLICILYVCG